jgi:hypothetical protein
MRSHFSLVFYLQWTLQNPAAHRRDVVIYRGGGTRTRNDTMSPVFEAGGCTDSPTPPRIRWVMRDSNPRSAQSTAELQTAPFAARVNHPAVSPARGLLAPRARRALDLIPCSSPGAAVLETIQQRQELRSQGRALRLVGVGEAGHDGQLHIRVLALRQVNPSNNRHERSRDDAGGPRPATSVIDYDDYARGRTEARTPAPDAADRRNSRTRPLLRSATWLPGVIESRRAARYCHADFGPPVDATRSPPAAATPSCTPSSNRNSSWRAGRC